MAPILREQDRSLGFGVDLCHAVPLHDRSCYPSEVRPLRAPCLGRAASVSESISYDISLRRRKPAMPSSPVPNNIKDPGSGTWPGVPSSEMLYEPEPLKGQLSV